MVMRGNHITIPIKILCGTNLSLGGYHHHGGPNQLDVADPGIVALVNEQEMQTPFSKTGHVEVGASAKTPGTLGKDHVVVTVVYKDGKRSVALDTFV